MQKTVLALLPVLFWIAVSGQVADDTIGGMLVYGRYERVDGFMMYAPQPTESTSNLVVFVHGYGALNPKVYGGWIKHLVAQGHTVVYPRYQVNMFTPSADEFVTHTATAIRHALTLVDSIALSVDTSAIYLIGHSYGGVIISNLAVNGQEFDLPPIKVAFLSEPGHGPLTGGVLESYIGMPDDIYLAIIVGNDDWTVGQAFGLKVLETADVDNRVLFWQYADENDDEKIEASHYEPYSYTEALDNGISNFTVNRAQRVSAENAVDYQGYWKIFDSLMALAHREQPYSLSLLELWAQLGKWSDGTAIRPMEIKTGDD